MGVKGGKGHLRFKTEVVHAPLTLIKGTFDSPMMCVKCLEDKYV